MASSSSSSKPLDSPRPSKKTKINDDHEGTTAPTPTPNWLELPGEVTAKILHKVGAMEMMKSAEHVCTLWRKICKDPLMWRTIHVSSYYKGDIVCRHAIDRSCGHLENIHLEYLTPTDDLLYYIANSTSHLRRMRLQFCDRISDKALIEVAKKLPLLEELELSLSYLSSNSLEAVGTCCPRLTSLRFNRKVYPRTFLRNDADAFAIAKNMPKLQHLQLIGNSLTDAGLLAILDGCPLLESLDLRGCFEVSLKGSLRKRCADQIKELRFPHEHIDDENLCGDPFEMNEYCVDVCDCGCGDSPDRFVVDENELFAARVAEELGLW